MRGVRCAVVVGGVAAAIPAWAGPILTPGAGGYGRGVSRYVFGSVVQELEDLSFTYPTIGIDYQRAEQTSDFGFAGGAGFGESDPLAGKLTFSTGTRAEADSSFQHIGDGTGRAFYNDTFDVRSDTLADGTVIELVFRFAASTLDSTNHTAQTGSAGSNNANNSGSAFVRVRTDGPSENLFEESGTYTRNRAGDAGATGVFADEFVNEDGDPNTHTGQREVVLEAVVGSTITLEVALEGGTESRAMFNHKGNTGFCASLLFGFSVEDGYLESRLVPGMPVPGLAGVTPDGVRAIVPPGPEFVVPGPGVAVVMLAGIAGVCRRR